MQLHPKQQEIARSSSQFKPIRAGRKGGKTAFEVENISFKATSSLTQQPHLTKKVIPHRNIIYLASTQKQARTIVWEPLKSRLSKVGEYKEATLELTVPTVDGAKTTIHILGWENREKIRGMFDVIHITFDETDSMKNFFISFEEIFLPMILDTNCSMDFIGTPDRTNPNLKRLERNAVDNILWENFHFTSKDNPYISQEALLTLTKDMDGVSYKQEILAEHIEDSGSLLKYTALVDMFSNTVEKENEKYLLVDVADDGSDKTVFSFWQGLECYRIEIFQRLNTEGIINQIREYASQDRIPYSQIAVDAIGVGAGVASSSLLDGIIGFKSSYQAMKTDLDPVRLPNVHYTKNVSLTSDYRNLRSQCVFTLANLVNNHKIAVKTEDIRIKEQIIEELALYQDVSKGDGKRLATAKEDIKALLGRSPDLSDTLIMRMYFELRNRLSPNQSEERIEIAKKLANQFEKNRFRNKLNSGR